ncbi:hypothetical protein V511_06600 [Mesotoga sp. Brook.08.YT.4.2.5.1]|uniref:DUF368 domain-containing protein n=1 Tax=unclassified Mesotoga TaxID=1184398 RepID=UPI000C197493|nr:MULTISPECIES: DUF368 domain-containing protein [unclassified Mesotoga]RAM59059.1 hypothetical protein DS65_01390 [Mesotoga sp. SC_4PWL113PWK15]PNE22615.1 hypothetical protein V511_06600 [Mesotoga sp. Brook.08.YT.4.2.5.1]PVD16079.1 hypothetical protein V512_003910 [Mesotoga sp. Brook.08.105.5.1]RAO95758.1 hypothetical protein M388_04500 [Mesotoga sp. Brook.08.YT.4.2.5.4.]RDI94123.1 hypothetical protein Q502_01195 [Mesotoga sp. Brook.08.YT.4.2.5.2.]
MLYVIFVGVLMGLANLIPGVSGGTIALLGGIYERFVDSVSSLTALRIKKKEFVFLIQLIAGIGIGIFAFAALIDLSLSVVPSLMYGMFSGLVAGGIPVVFRRIEKIGATSIISFAAGVVLVVIISLLGSRSVEGSVSDRGALNLVFDVVAGFFGAAAMVLPGLSGAFILLLLGEYTRAISALKNLDLVIIAFIGVGVILGVVFVSRLLKFLMKRYRCATFSFLLGLMLGSIPDLLSRPGINFNLIQIAVGILSGLAFSYLIVILEKRNRVRT